MLIRMGLVLAACASLAQPYPAKPVRVIVPFPPAGAADIVARHASNALSEAFGVQFIVENRAGAGGAIGGEAAARATPDGYTLLMASSSTMSINPHFAAKQSYDPQTSFSPVVLVGYATNVVAVHPSVPVHTIRELIALAKAKPGEYNYAAGSIGAASHLSGELFKLTYKLDLQMVPFPGAAPAITSTIAGHTPIAFTALPPAVTAAVANPARPAEDRSVDAQRLRNLGVLAHVVLGTMLAAIPKTKRFESVAITMADDAKKKDEKKDDSADDDVSLGFL